MATFCRYYYRVPFSETDAMGIVHHSNHPRYLERGRVEFLREVGFPYTEIMKQGIHIPLTDLSVSYKKPLQFDEILLVETSISDVTRVRLNFKYRIFSAPELLPTSLANEPFEGSPSVLGETFHCAVNDQGRPVPMNASLLQTLQKLKGSL